MVETHNNTSQTQIILSPNRSMSWESNKKILLAIFCVNLIVALAWTMMGACMVLPFAGLEVACVGAGMYYVSWKLSFKQIITIEQESLVVQKGVYFPKQEWRWQRSNTTLIHTPSRYRLSAPLLQLQHLNEVIEIGDFLNRDEKKELKQQFELLSIPQVNRPAQ